MITLLLLVRATYMYGVVLHAHPVRSESHNQRNTTGEVATNEPHLLHVLFVKVAPETTFSSWSKHHFVVTGKADQQVCKAAHCGTK